MRGAVRGGSGIRAALGPGRRGAVVRLLPESPPGRRWPRSVPWRTGLKRAPRGDVPHRPGRWPPARQQQQGRPGTRATPHCLIRQRRPRASPHTARRPRGRRRVARRLLRAGRGRARDRRKGVCCVCRVQPVTPIRVPAPVCCRCVWPSGQPPHADGALSHGGVNGDEAGACEGPGLCTAPEEIPTSATLVLCLQCR